MQPSFTMKSPAVGLKAVRQKGPDLFHYGALVSEIIRVEDVCILSVDSGGRLRQATDPLGNWAPLDMDPAIEMYRAVLRNGEPLVIEDASRDPASLEDYVAESSHSFWAVMPLRALSGDLRGLLVARREMGGPLAGRTRVLLDLICAQIGAHLDYRVTRRQQDPLRLLAALDELREFDPDIASHTLFGFMRMAARQPPRAVERTALLISGLAEERDGVFSFNRDGHRLEVMYQLDLLHYVPDADERRKPLETKLFAAIRVGSVEYEVGSNDEDEKLFVRLGRDKPWLPLWRKMGDGWQKIAAEIIRIARDATHEYIRMHMIDLTEDARGHEHAFDLYGIRWNVRGKGETLEVLHGSDLWKPVRLPEDIDQQDYRAQVALALMIANPGIVRKLSHDVEDWTNRIAAGAIVVPVFNP